MPDALLAWGHGLVTRASDGVVLDAWFPAPALGRPDGSTVPAELVAAAGPDERRDVTLEPVTVEVRVDDAPASTADAYLRLHLLSHLVVKPNEINLDGLFTHLPIVAFTNAGPVAADTYRARRALLAREGIQAYAVDKFPRLTDYVVPERVRIADSARVRLGAYLSPGTTVMPEGFVNFNAGTLGASMVEGRISQGVVVGDGSDIGGGASTMGTLSGGGLQRVVIGERVLLGANSGTGISIGDDSIVEAGLYLTAGTKVTVLDERDSEGDPKVVKALDLAGRPGLLFRRNSTSGRVEAAPHHGAGIALNAELHP
ncbi:2,3,4,5-tetrahydropyridine-2,6-dicarboxylate N-succinyltransferase [Gryllotalpicola sp.]|uniref:2,3,4,5-tetrahydropyridine-2,6-dicarboxylate N-succinyltransferase n=1 Tax=Gryllotalpicola sp. TaxID=1932787 RepID=UPI002613E156|nr:2,3,4,5-tetrahydropyridine-2,6-dicarboxylate N-succinyltransferase [Gryllotalpicola sp.]